MDSDEEGMVRSAAQGAHAEFIISGGVGPARGPKLDCRPHMLPLCLH